VQPNDMKKQVILLIILLIAQYTYCQENSLSEYKILPRDESTSDFELVSFINSLKTIISNQDTAKFFSVLDKNIIVSYGGGITGIEEFSKNWNLKKPGNVELWIVLKQIINLGGTWESDEDGKFFCIPYTQSNKLFGKYTYDFNWYITAVCTSSKTKVFKEPKLSSEVLGNLRYDIVEIDPDASNINFTKINTIDKKTQGYVKTSDLIYSAGPHLILRKQNASWKITAFAPFD
jgi:hypothetical protein